MKGFLFEVSLLKGLHFDSSTYDVISFVDSVDGAEVSLPLGKITAERDNLLWTEGDYVATISSVAFALLIIFGITLVALSFAGCYTFYQRGSGSKTVQKV